MLCLTFILLILIIYFVFRDSEGSLSKPKITIEMDPPKVALEVLSYHNAASIEEVCSRDFIISFFSSSEMLCFVTCSYSFFILLQVEEILTTKDTDEPIEEIAS